MPKLRDPVDSLRDAQRHLSVFKSRSTKSDTNRDSREIATKINEVIATIDYIINKLPEEAKSFSDKLISSELDLINKEVKKNVPKIDYRAAVRAMCNVTSIAEAKKIGLQYNIPEEQVNQVINKASIDTELGKAVAKYKLAIQKQKAKQTPITPAVITPNEEQEDITNDSEPLQTDEFEMDDDLKRLTGVDQ
jgi:hypothetical protein